MSGKLVPPLRWTARIWSLASVGLILAFAIGEPHQGGPGMTWLDGLGVLFFPVGVGVGMVMGWWRERLGGTLATGSLLAFYILQFVEAGAFPRGWAFLVFAAPGPLFLILSSIKPSHQVFTID